MFSFQRDSLTVEKDADGSVMLKLDVPNRAVNVFNSQVLADVDAALDYVRDAPGRIPVLVVRSGKTSGFVAGADLQEFATIRSSAEAEAISARGQAVMNKLAELPIPTIAAIHGPCLGGGLEFALACDYRLVYEKAGTQLGFPELELGLLPGWTGTQRLPTTIGLERSLQVILGGKRLKAQEAFRWGLADALATNETELRDHFEKLKRRAIEQGKRQRAGLPLRTWRQRLVESTPLGRRLLFKGAERLLRRKAPDDMPAPFEALEAVRVGQREGMAAGLLYERQAAGRLAVSPACHNLMGVFFAREKARKLPPEWEHLGPREIRRVGVVGAGTMGAGIAQLAAVKGCEVIVQEINAEALGSGMLRITDLFKKAFERGVLSEADVQKRLSAIRGTFAWDGFDEVDLVIEAALEDLTAKQKVFHELEAHTKPTVPLATNTSSLPVGSLQDGSAHPERVAGLHFFNPVHKMPLVEVARAPASSDTALATLTRLAIALGKTPVVVRDSPGFVVNRVLMPYLNEAVLLVAEGLKIEQIDKVMKRFGMPVGPLELLDHIGLDIAAHVARSMEPSLNGRFPRNTAFERMCANGWLGAKSGKGFYRYQGKKRQVNEPAQNLLRAEATPSAKLPPTARLADARERLVLLMVNEAALCVSEHLTDDPDAVDLAMVMGTGWAPHRGGPLRYADERGLDQVVTVLENLARRLGPRFEPCGDLKRRAAIKERFRPNP